MRIALFNRAVIKVDNLAQVITFLVERGIHSTSISIFLSLAIRNISTASEVIYEVERRTCIARSQVQTLLKS